MKFSTFGLLVLFAMGHAAYIYETPVINERNIVPTTFEFSDACGHVFTSNAGRIEYTSNFTAGEEFCVWIVRSSEIKEFTFDVLQMNVNNGRQTYLGFSQIVHNGQTFSNININKLGKYRFTGGVVLISFTTSKTIPIYRRQFVLEFTSVPIQSMDISPKSVQNFYNGIEQSPPISLKYPESGEYDNRELSVLVFTPPNWTYDMTNKKSRFELKTSGLDESCTDSVSTFTLQTGSSFSQINTSPWQRCNSSIVRYDRYDTFPAYAVVFKSDNSTVGSGFGITYDWGPSQI